MGTPPKNPFFGAVYQGPSMRSTRPLGTLPAGAMGYRFQSGRPGPVLYFSGPGKVPGHDRPKILHNFHVYVFYIIFFYDFFFIFFLNLAETSDLASPYPSEQKKIFSFFQIFYDFHLFSYFFSIVRFISLYFAIFSIYL